MDMRFRLLDSFAARGSDGATYKVFAYDRLVRDPAFANGSEHWEATGEVEYRLADGRLVEVARDGTAQVAHGNLQLTLPDRWVH
ncbi:MAG: hypothetical protein HY854_10300 [Burkholderiales bacterium]|nr:hypothetical protein [Burkholderiales bacterium]